MARNMVFGTGPVGIAVARSLRSRHENVTVVNRSGKIPAGLAGTSVDVVAGDLMDTESVLKLASGAERLFHCANPLYHEWGTLLPLMQENLVTAAIQNSAVLTLSENLYAYSGDAEYIDENTPEEPPTRKGAIRLELTRKLENAAEEKGLKWTSIRGSDYYGPWSTFQSMFGTDRFLDLLSRGKSPVMLGSLDYLHSYTFVEDFGEAMVIASADKDAHGRAWICPNAPARTTGEIARQFISSFPGLEGKSPEPKTVPEIALRVMGIFNPVIREIPEMLYQKKQTYVADGQLFSNRFGFRPTSTDEGIRKTLDWYTTVTAGTAA